MMAGKWKGRGSWSRRSAWSHSLNALSLTINLLNFHLVILFSLNMVQLTKWEFQADRTFSELEASAESHTTQISRGNFTIVYLSNITGKSSKQILKQTVHMHVLRYISSKLVVNNQQTKLLFQQRFNWTRMFLFSCLFIGLMSSQQRQLDHVILYWNKGKYSSDWREVWNHFEKLNQVQLKKDRGLRLRTMQP